MIRISGVNIPENKNIEFALRYIHGVGLSTAKQVIAKLKIDPFTKAKDLTEEQIRQIRDEIQENHLVEGELRKKVAMDIKRLVDLGCYRGVRHRKRLPVRGQRTHTNARTRRGRAIPIAGKKK
ncbi:MAG: 30S ribosomal protein S13 [Alphaproteobacteria bacterium]|nr:MAG: 30S ribosomal protein S13 [Alphaproteobacteria bacterium]